MGPLIAAEPISALYVGLWTGSSAAYNRTRVHTKQKCGWDCCSDSVCCRLRGTATLRTYISSFDVTNAAVLTETATMGQTRQTLLIDYGKITRNTQQITWARCQSDWWLKMKKQFRLILRWRTVNSQEDRHFPCVPATPPTWTTTRVVFFSTLWLVCHHGYNNKHVCSVVPTVVTMVQWWFS